MRGIAVGVLMALAIGFAGVDVLAHGLAGSIEGGQVHHTRILILDLVTGGLAIASLSIIGRATVRAIRRRGARRSERSA